MSHYDCRQQQVSIDQTPTTAIEIRNMHDIFLDPYRCALLHYLQRADGPVSVRNVASTVEEWSPDGDDAEMEYEGQPVAWFRETHVRPMEAFGVLVYDHEDDVVHLAEDASFSVGRPWTAE